MCGHRKYEHITKLVSVAADKCFSVLEKSCSREEGFKSDSRGRERERKRVGYYITTSRAEVK